LSEEASRKAGRPLVLENYDFNTLVKSLGNAEKYFQNVANNDMRMGYVLRQPDEILEFMVCPDDESPIIHELLPRLSWNKTMRNYHNAPAFIRKFEAENEQGRKKMLEEVYSSINFSNQQNNDVNLWLFKNYNKFCIESGVNFNVIN
jgi:hypothetical protein